MTSSLPTTARRHRNPPTATTETQPAAACKVVLDHLAFPHIFDAIVAHAPWDSLKVLRQTSRDVSEQVDARLGGHITVVNCERTGRTMVSGTDGMPLPGFRAWQVAQEPPRAEPTRRGVKTLLAGMAGLVFGGASGAAVGSGTVQPTVSPPPLPRSPLHIFRHTRVVNIKDMFAPEDLEFLPSEITQQCTVRDLYRTEFSARCLIPCDVFVGSVELDDPLNMWFADDAPGVRRIVMTYFLPEVMDVHNGHYEVHDEWDEALREVVVMYQPKPEVEGPVKATYAEGQSGLGALHGWRKFIAATKGRVTVSFVGFDQLDGAFVGLHGTVSNAVIKDHIVAHVLASHPDDTSRDVVFDSVIVESYDERRTRIGERQFALEDIRPDVYVKDYP